MNACKHFKILPASEQVLVKDTRVEIDAVVTVVGSERFWNYLEDKMELAPQRDLTRSVDLTIKLPPEISTPLAEITEAVRSVGARKQEEIKEELRNWKEGFVDVKEKEKEIQSDIIEEIREDKQVPELAAQLKKLANSISKNS